MQESTSHCSDCSRVAPNSHLQSSVLQIKLAPPCLNGMDSRLKSSSSLQLPLMYLKNTPIQVIALILFLIFSTQFLFAHLFVCSFVCFVIVLYINLPCCFGCQSWTSRESGINFNDVVLQGSWMQSKLDIALSHYIQMSDNLDGTIPQHLKFLISECLAWRHYDRIPCLSQGSREGKWEAVQQQKILAT